MVGGSVGALEPHRKCLDFGIGWRVASARRGTMAKAGRICSALVSSRFQPVGRAGAGTRVKSLHPSAQKLLRTAASR
jgi:hypothetical protein